MAAVTLTLGCSDDAIDSLVREVEATGMRVDHVHRTLGILTGEVDPSRIPELSRLDGVTAVEAARGFFTPPPDGDVQ
ncbi:hypothetical protein [Tsukamurella sp. NPDC003166]|uniref:hypothetical protein n=1 Tax=Tsukamurella sp. NPDC003166 TaxID=3154444 RepID=UPI0033AE07BC